MGENLVELDRNDVDSIELIQNHFQSVLTVLNFRDCMIVSPQRYAVINTTE
jgi:hypothetical protein